MHNSHTHGTRREGSISINLSGLDAVIRRQEIEAAAMGLWNCGCSLARFDADMSIITMTETQRATVLKVRAALEEIVEEDRREHGDD